MVLDPDMGVPERSPDPVWPEWSANAGDVPDTEGEDDDD